MKDSFLQNQVVDRIFETILYQDSFDKFDEKRETDKHMLYGYHHTITIEYSDLYDNRYCQTIEGRFIVSRVYDGDSFSIECDIREISPPQEILMN